MKLDTYYRVGNLLLTIHSDGDVTGFVEDEPRCLSVRVACSDVERLAYIALEALKRRLERKREKYERDLKEVQKAIEYLEGKGPEDYISEAAWEESREILRNKVAHAKELELKIEDIDDRLELISNLLSLLAEEGSG